MWEGLPPTRSSLVPVVNTTGVNPLIAAQPANSLLTANNLYALTANYQFHMEGRRFGFYFNNRRRLYFSLSHKTEGITPSHLAWFVNQSGTGMDTAV
jgi:hypothetical protein